MAYKIRAIESAQWGEALQLWEDVFGVGRWLFDSLHKGTADRKWSHCGVAVDESGRIVSAVDLFMRQVRDESGSPVKVAAVGSVATLEEARKQGLSGQLLERALEQMRLENCAWSHLFTGTHHHYRRYGWFDAPLKSRRGRFKSVPLPSSGARVLNDQEKDAFLSLMRQWWEADNVARPLTQVRSEQYWREAIRPRMGQGSINENREVVLVEHIGEPIGYAVIEKQDEKIRVVETGGDHRLALSGSASLYPGGEVVFDLPFDAPWDEAIQLVSDDVSEQPEPWSMARGLPSGLSDELVKAIFAAKGAHHWQLDNF